jgi:DNA-binding XRE family transcriptional regulator
VGRLDQSEEAGFEAHEAPAFPQPYNVSDVRIYLWERNNVRPSLAQIPKIIEFLGRDPFGKETPNLGEKIREYRQIHGLSQKKLAEQLGVDPTTLAGWERSKRQPNKRLFDHMKKIGFIEPLT